MKVWTLEELYRTNCAEIPAGKGIYRVLVPEGMEIRFTETSPNPSVVPYEKEVLEEKYAKCHDKRTLYIGKANGRNGLQQRIRQYIHFAFGDKKTINHKGGRAIWQIENYESLLLTYEECADCETVEHDLLKEYKDRNKGGNKDGVYPLANWKG